MGKFYLWIDKWKDIVTVLVVVAAMSASLYLVNMARVKVAPDVEMPLGLLAAIVFAAIWMVTCHIFISAKIIRPLKTDDQNLKSIILLQSGTNIRIIRDPMWPKRGDIVRKMLWPVNPVICSIHVNGVQGIKHLDFNIVTRTTLHEMNLKEDLVAAYDLGWVSIGDSMKIYIKGLIADLDLSQIIEAHFNDPEAARKLMLTALRQLMAKYQPPKIIGRTDLAVESANILWSDHDSVTLEPSYSGLSRQTS
jgi:hypothetical protein